MHPELTSKVNSIIHQCWKAGESTELGKVKISVDGVFARLYEMQLHKIIRLSELPLAGKIRQKKAKITYEQLDLEKDLSQWKKQELEAYLSHHKIAKTGNNS